MTERDRRRPAPPATAAGAPMSTNPAGVSSASAVDAFVAKVRTLGPPQAAGAGGGRLMFAMDATASRQPTWDRAMEIQSEMFSAAAGLGGLSVQLVFYRGFRECKASPWVADAAGLLQRMTAVSCLGGRTQIGRVLSHAQKESRARKVDAVVFVGDACEEDADPLCHAAGELGLLGVPVFVFHEGGDPAARRVFTQIAKLSGGAYCRLDSGSARQLRDLLRAVAAYAAGGRAALRALGRDGSEEVLLLTRQLGG